MSATPESAMAQSLKTILECDENIEWVMQAPALRHWRFDQGGYFWSTIGFIFLSLMICVGLFTLWMILFSPNEEARESILGGDSLPEMILFNAGFTVIAAIFFVQFINKLIRLRRSHYVFTSARALLVTISKSCQVLREVQWREIRMSHVIHNKDGTGDLTLAARSVAAIAPDQTKSHIEFFGVENPVAVEKLCYALRTKHLKFEGLKAPSSSRPNLDGIVETGETIVWSHKPSFFPYLLSTGNYYSIPFLMIGVAIGIFMIRQIPLLADFVMSPDRIGDGTGLTKAFELTFITVFAVIWSGFVLFVFYRFLSELKAKLWHFNPTCLLTDKRVLNIFSKSRSLGVSKSDIDSFEVHLQKGDRGLIKVVGKCGNKTKDVVFADVADVLRVEYEIAKLRGLV